MTRWKVGTAVGGLAVCVAAACSTINRSYVAGGDVDLSMATPARLGADETALLRQMSDGNILGHLMALDSLEITMADTALRYLKSDDANAFARMMHIVHDDDRKALRDIADASGIIPTIDVARIGASHVAAGIDSVRRTSDITKDQQFIRAQIELHQHALAELQVLEGTARSAALRQHISAMIPIVRDHLARAQAIARPLGVR